MVNGPFSALGEDTRRTERPLRAASPPEIQLTRWGRAISIGFIVHDVKWVFLPVLACYLTPDINHKRKYRLIMKIMSCSLKVDLCLFHQDDTAPGDKVFTYLKVLVRLTESQQALQKPYSLVTGTQTLPRQNACAHNTSANVLLSFKQEDRNDPPPVHRTGEEKLVGIMDWCRFYGQKISTAPNLTSLSHLEVQ